MANGNEDTCEERERLIEERKNRLKCIHVCEDGLECGKVFEVRCVAPRTCLAAQGCYWRAFHKM